MGQNQSGSHEEEGSRLWELTFTPSDPGSVSHSERSRPRDPVRDSESKVEPCVYSPGRSDPPTLTDLEILTILVPKLES